MFQFDFDRLTLQDTADFVNALLSGYRETQENILHSSLFGANIGDTIEGQVQATQTFLRLASRCSVVPLSQIPGNQLRDFLLSFVGQMSDYMGNPSEQ